jgi:Ca2+-binding EF-hand superfamily protein
MRIFKPLMYCFICILTLSGSVGLAYAKNEKYEMKYSNMDVNQDGIVTRNEWHGSDNLFNISDWNGDGVLSGNEVTGGARRGDDYDRHHSEGRFRELDQSKNSVISRQEWDGLIEAFNWLDDNHDGVLTRTEFINHRVEGTDRFTELDRDRDGYISRTEWNGSAVAFNYLDKNHDGQLSRPEFPTHLEANNNRPSHLSSSN